MKPAENPFAPGAGTPPPELAGRDDVLADAEVSLRRIISGTPDRGHLLLGLRGVGKTVLLNRIDDIATELGYLTLSFEASEGGRLADQLAPRLNAALIKLSRVEKAKATAKAGLHLLRNFASAFRVTIGGVDVQVGRADEPGADTGDLEIDLPDLLVAVGLAAKSAGTAVAILIDEVQYLTEQELSATIRAIHLISQKNLPVILVGAGLPQLAALAGDAKSYAERLFRYPRIDKLDHAAARAAIETPLHRKGVRIEADALERMIQATQGYPYFLQEWGSFAWRAADASPITDADVARAGEDALLQLDNDFFRVRFDRLTPTERDYMRAMASLGPGPHPSGAIAEALGKTTSAVGVARDGVIKKGMAYSPRYGYTGFTVPMFDAFMVRVMPVWKPPRVRVKPRKK